MSNISGPSIYIPSDKNIFDALQHKKIKHSDILNFLRQRGILVSESLDKADLSKFIARLTFDYQDYVAITKLLENPNRKEKTTRSTVKSNFSTEQLKEVCDLFSESSPESDSIKINKKGDSYFITTTYTDMDFTRTALTQRTLKKCEIELSCDGSETTIRRPANNKGAELSQKIIVFMSNIKEETLEEECINLEHIATHRDRSDFFITLMNSIDGFTIEDVSSVDVYHEIDDLDDESDVEKQSFEGFIKKAALAGGGVLNSPEFNQLSDNGFFISKVIWTVVDNVSGGDKVELEAQFGIPSSCSDFKYLVRNIYNYSPQNRCHNKTKRSPSRIETESFNKKLESAAKIAFDKINTKYEDL